MSRPKTAAAVFCCGAALVHVLGCDQAVVLPVPDEQGASAVSASAPVVEAADAGSGDADSSAWPLYLPPVPAATDSVEKLGLPTKAGAFGGRSGSIDPMGVKAADEEAAEPQNMKALVARIRVYDKHAESLQKIRDSTAPLPKSLRDQPPPKYVDITRRSGLANITAFVGKRTHSPFEDSGSGLGWADYDNDGDPDLYIARYNALRNYMKRVPDLRSGLLMRNNGDGTFTDQTTESGLTFFGQTLGVSWADYNGDGNVDLYLTNYGPNRLFRSNGDGTFTDVTKAAGVGDSRFSAAATWGDYDRDGDIDLYVGNYADCRINNLNLMTENRRMYMGPMGKAVSTYETDIYDQFPVTDVPPLTEPQTNTLYRNNGDGTFTDVTKAAGVEDGEGRSLGALMLDLDEDGWPELYVANDVSPNTLFANNGDGTFKDVSRKTGMFDPRAGMGIAVGDPDADGDFDFFMSYFSLETNGMMENLRVMFAGGPPGRLRFASHEEYWGLGEGSYGYVAWGTSFLDWDLDGDQDLFIANGHVADLQKPAGKIGPQRNTLYTNLLREEGVVRYFDITDRAGPGFNDEIYCSRGTAIADFDQDGDMDIAITNMTDGIQLLRNDARSENRWLKVRLVGAGANTQGLGARVEVVAGELVQKLPVYSGAAYLSTDHRVLVYGLGKAKAVDRVTVWWPSGKKTTVPGADVKLDSLLVVREEG